jgi:hypothetical protein
LFLCVLSGDKISQGYVLKKMNQWLKKCYVFSRMVPYTFHENVENQCGLSKTSFYQVLKKNQGQNLKVPPAHFFSPLKSKSSPLPFSSYYPLWIPGGFPGQSLNQIPQKCRLPPGSPKWQEHLLWLSRPFFFEEKQF